MKKDIHFEEVKDIAVAIVKEEDEESKKTIWNVYLINLKGDDIKNILVNSNGYGVLKEENVKTSTLRFFFEKLEALDFVLIEPIMENVFALNNEYWVSFYLDEKIQDKKFIFLAESIIEKNLVKIPIINKMGIMIK